MNIFHYGKTSLHYVHKLFWNKKQFLFPTFFLLLLSVGVCQPSFANNNKQANKEEKLPMITAPTYYIDQEVEGLDVALASHSDEIEGVFHLFYHGKPGALLLDGKWESPAAIAAWLSEGQYLVNKTHLNIYGCNFAQGEAGHAAVSYLETALGISIAASDDWELEVGTPIASIRIINYFGNLQCGISALAYSDNCTGDDASGYTADWKIGFSTINAPDNAISYQRNNEAVQSHTLTGTTDTLTIAGIPADGGAYDTLKVWFTNDPTCTNTIISKRPLPCPVSPLNSYTYLDFNGANDYATLPDIPLFDFGATQDLS